MVLYTLNKNRLVETTFNNGLPVIGETLTFSGEQDLFVTVGFALNEHGRRGITWNETICFYRNVDDEELASELKDFCSILKKTHHEGKVERICFAIRSLEELPHGPLIEFRDFI